MNDNRPGAHGGGTRTMPPDRPVNAGHILRPTRRHLILGLAAGGLPGRGTGASTLRPLRIGYVVNGPERGIFEEKFEAGMAENGYVAGRNLAIDYRHQLRPDHDLREVMAAFVAASVDAIVVATRGGVLAALPEEAGLPTICEWRSMAEAGRLLRHGTVNEALRRQVARHVARVLRGQLPGELPMVQPERFETVVNLRTARRMGVELSPLVLAAAGDVIE